MNFANGGQTTLSGAIGAGDATLTVADGTVFPAVPFHVCVDTELMTVTANLGGLLSVTRGIEGTAAAAHAAGALVTNTVTAGDFAGFAALVGNVALLNAANVFSVSPQEIDCDTDAHAGLIIKRNSGTSTAGFLRFNDQTGTLVGVCDPRDNPSTTPTATTGGRFHAVLNTAGYGLSFFSSTNGYGGLFIGPRGIQYGTESANPVQLFTSNVVGFRIESTGEVCVSMGRDLGVSSPGATGIPLTSLLKDAGTGTSPVALRVMHESSNTPAALFGVTMQLAASTATVGDRPQIEIQTHWRSSAADATRKAGCDLVAYDAAGSRIAFSFGSDGTNPVLTFFNGNFNAQQTVTGKLASAATVADLVATLQSLMAALATKYNLVVDGTT